MAELPNGNKLEISDFFFKFLNEDENYCKQENLPYNIEIFNSNYQQESNLPILFGNSEIEEISENGKKLIILSADIFSSGFFLLTSMEEYVIDSTDAHDRFKGKDSLSRKYNFLHRPIVNEYADLFWNILLYLGYDEGFRSPSQFEIIPTHDIDTVYYNFRWSNFAADILLDKNPKRAIKRLSLERKNYWDRFTWLMDVSEKNNLKSIFYFMAGANHQNDNDYKIEDTFINKKIDEIKSRGHAIGLHPGYETMLDLSKFRHQKESLENAIGYKIIENRQHYLRFKIPNSYSILEKNRIEVDSSLMFPDEIGFRCGTSSLFPLFDLNERRQVNVMERPLIIMDTLLRDRKNSEKSALASVEIVESYKEKCKKYKIPLTILFHNNSFDPIRWDGWSEVYENYFH